MLTNNELRNVVGGLSLSTLGTVVNMFKNGRSCPNE